MLTRVCITVDTEFSIGGAFADAARLPVAEPMVWCEVDGRSEGLGFLLEQMRLHRIPATFFVEALQRLYFRKDPMRPIARRLRDDGHDVQLHLHPCWSVFRHEDWRARVRREPRQDDFAGRPEQDTLALLREGMATFADWDMARPVLFRSGSLQHDAALYRALARAGIPYSSSVGTAIYDSGDADYRLYSGLHRRHGVLEFPLLTFQDWRVGRRRHLKTLTIAGTSFAETRQLLRQAHAEGVPLVVLLTHPFEYVQRAGDDTRMRRHAVNQQRLAQLCGFLDGARDQFLPCALADAARALDGGAERNLLLRGNPLHSVRRMAAQVSYDRYGAWALRRRAAA